MGRKRPPRGGDGPGRRPDRGGDRDGAERGGGGGGVPSVIERAIGTRNLSDDRLLLRGGAIVGLRGYLLPRYLELRCGLLLDNGGVGEGVGNGARPRANGPRRLPEPLMRAREEEELSRRRRRRRIVGGGGAGGGGDGGSSRSGKRKRRRANFRAERASTDGARADGGGGGGAAAASAAAAAEAAASVAAVAESAPDGVPVAEGQNESKKTGRRTRRGRRKRKRGEGGTGIDAAANESEGRGGDAPSGKGGDSGERGDDPNWIHHRTMARIVVAPFAPWLVATMERCLGALEEWEAAPSSSVASEVAPASSGGWGGAVGGGDGSAGREGAVGEGAGAALSAASTAATTAAALAATTTANATVPQDASTGAAAPGERSGNTTIARARNVYRKEERGSSTSTIDRSFLLDMSPPRESLETVVDGAVDTLVRRSHRFREVWKDKGDRRSAKVVHRRRSRDKERGGRHLPKKGSGGRSSAEVDRGGGGKTGGGSNSNNWLLERNLLSAGYSLGSGEPMPRQQQPSTAANGIVGATMPPQPRGCPNMAPGVHCRHPNALTSYARSSPLMRALHGLVGDDAVREMLVNAAVFVPAVPSDEEEDDDDGEGVEEKSPFRRGNYFQLCGPPANVLSRRFDSEAAAAASSGPPSSSAGAREGGEGGYGGAAGRARKRRRRTPEAGGAGPCPPQSAAGEDVCSDPSCASAERATRAGERWDPNRPIPRGGLFYCDFYNRRVGLSPRHLLNQRDVDGGGGGKGTEPSRASSSSSAANDADVRLLNAMVQIWPSGRDRSNAPSPFKGVGGDGSAVVVGASKRRRRWRRLRESGAAVCREVRRRHRGCDYARLLERHCPLPARADAVAGDDDLAGRVASHTPVECVGSFLESVLRRAFPASFWGSGRNFRQVVRTANVFVRLGRTEQLPEKAIVEGIRVLDITWLHGNKRAEAGGRSAKLCRSDHEAATTLVRNVMRWLYFKFIIPLLRSVFYITETEFTGSRVLYYRRPVWARIRDLSMEVLLGRQYRELTAAKARKLLSNHNVGCPPAPLRLLPKKTGIRAIAMLSKACCLAGGDGVNPTKGGAGRPFARQRSDQAPPNKILQSTFHALRYEHEKKPSLFGSGVLGLTEVFPSFCLFVEALRQKRSGTNPPCGRSDLYFASADIRHCYDTINQKRLYKLMGSVVEEDVYLTKNNFVLHSKGINETLRCQWRRSTFAPDQFVRFGATSGAHARKYFRSLFVDSANCSMEKKERITGLLRDHIFGQVVVASGSCGERYLHQKNGIPQGSILSSMLCNIYFGHIEGRMLDGLFEDGSSIIIKGRYSSKFCDALLLQNDDLHLLVRIVDDFLLISTSRETSDRFLKKLNRGVPRLGVKINRDKSRASYLISTEDATTGTEGAVVVCRDFFPWCGLLIDTKTCEITLDHSRFCNSQATDTVAIHRLGNEGANLKKKMKDFVRPRCTQRLLFSSRINDLGTVRVNFYQAFLLCAIKTRHYINGLGLSSLKHEEFIYRSACDTIKFAFLLITSKIKRGNDGLLSSLSDKFQLKWEDALWLGRHAFFSVFRESGNEYAKLSRKFCESSRSTTRKDLLAVTERASAMFD